MSNAIATRNEVSAPQHIGNLASIPLWIRKLIGAYPQSWANEMTYGLLHARFSKYDDKIMSTAVDLYIDEKAQFPTVADLRPYVERFTPKNDTAVFVASMLRAGFRFEADENNAMRFTEVSTGRGAEILH